MDLCVILLRRDPKLSTYLNPDYAQMMYIPFRSSSSQFSVGIVFLGDFQVYCSKKINTSVISFF